MQSYQFTFTTCRMIHMAFKCYLHVTMQCNNQITHQQAFTNHQ